MPIRTKQMNISLTPELAQFVRKNVKVGLYNNASEVLRDALRQMIRTGRRRGGTESITKQHRRLVEEGVAAIERGEYTDYDEDGLRGFFAGVVERGKKSLAAGHRQSTKQPR